MFKYKWFNETSYLKAVDLTNINTARCNQIIGSNNGSYKEDQKGFTYVIKTKKPSEDGLIILYNNQ